LSGPSESCGDLGARRVLGLASIRGIALTALEEFSEAIKLGVGQLRSCNKFMLTCLKHSAALPLLRLLAITTHQDVTQFTDSDGSFVSNW
jgi:hypothetical protein